MKFELFFRPLTICAATHINPKFSTDPADDDPFKLEKQSNDIEYSQRFNIVNLEIPNHQDNAVYSN